MCVMTHRIVKMFDVLIKGTNFRTAFLRVHPKHAISRAKAVPSFLRTFKILSIGPAPGIELYRIGANPAAVISVQL